MADHPSPWRWETEREGFTLRDANGADVIPTIVGSGYCDPDPADRALIAAAPEMEALLRDLEERWPTDDPQPCIVCHVPFADLFAPHPNEPKLVPHAPDCKLANLLKRLDAARKAGG